METNEKSTIQYPNDPPAIQELRHRVQKAEQLSGGYDNKGNHRLGKFLQDVLHAYDTLKHS